MARLLTLLLTMLPASVLAQLEVGGDLLDNCADIDGYTQSGNFAQAREAAQLCIEGIDLQLTGGVSGYFRDEAADWSRSSLDQSQAMGFTNISAVYAKDGDRVNVSLTGTPGGNSGIGGPLGGIAQSAIQGGGQRVTVAGIRSSLSPNGSLMVPLEGGYLSMFDSPDFNTAEQAPEGKGDFINEFPLAEINDAL